MTGLLSRLFVAVFRGRIEAICDGQRDFYKLLWTAELKQMRKALTEQDKDHAFKLLDKWDLMVKRGYKNVD